MSNPDIPLYLDEDVWMGLAAALRERHYDMIHAAEVDRKGLPDIEQLAYAAAAGRAILTHNTKDFVPLAARYFFEQRTHTGISLAQHLPKGELLRQTEKLLVTLRMATIANTVQFLADYR